MTHIAVETKSKILNVLVGVVKVYCKKINHMRK